MNEKLKFSWGHILAFVAIIFMGYITFMGGAYFGNFITAGIWAIGTIIILLLLFIGAQFLKGTEDGSKFDKRIIYERLFVFIAPLVLGALLFVPQLPYAHFWHVEDQHKAIDQQFKTSIDAAKQMFDDYEQYANGRIERLNSYLKLAVETKDSNKFYADLNFNGNYDEMQIETRVQALRTQLFPKDYNTLKKNAIEWIDAANHGATVWNVFLVGNVPVIKEAIETWHSQLQGFSKKTFTIEGNVSTFDEQENSMTNAQKGLEKLKDIYSSKDKTKTTPLSIVVTIICYLLLMMPYCLQRRSTNSRKRLFLPQNTHIHSHPKPQDPNHGIIWDSKKNANKKK